MTNMQTNASNFLCKGMTNMQRNAAIDWLVNQRAQYSFKGIGFKLG